MVPATSVALPVVSLLLAWSLSPRTLDAQRPATSLTLSTSLSTVNFAGIGGRFGAVVAQTTLVRRITDAAGVEINGFALVPGGGATADPACLPSQPCTSFSTPSAIVGSLVGPVVDVGTSGVRLSAGVGFARSTGGSGFSPRSSGAGTVAIEWRIRPRSRFSPSAGLRLATLAHPLAGARLLILPGLGVTF
jgi:hypothetical protein